jgi:hypothetical protein
VQDVPSDFDEVARTLVGVFEAEGAAAQLPVWVHLMDREGDAFYISIAPTDFPILGWVAPPECFAIGTVGAARVVPLDPHGPAGIKVSSAADGGARVACVVARSGAVSWFLGLPDGTEIDEPPEGGRILDVLRRCLQLPTPPPCHRIGRLHAVAWIGAVVEKAEARGRRLVWSEALSAHPAVSAHPGRAGSCAHGGQPEDLIRLAGEVGSWESMRLLVASGYQAPGMPRPEVAAWMDEGMFSRWVLGDLPPLEVLIEKSRQFLEPSAARRLAHLATKMA